MSENYTKSIRQSVPDGCSVVTQTSTQVTNNSLTSALRHLNKITEDFSSLINDEDGQSLFEEYAKLNDIDNYILFWFAIEGYRRRFNELDSKSSDTNRKNFQNEVTQMAKAIYNNFIKNNAKTGVFRWFSESTREMIYTKILNKNLDSDIFNQAKIEFTDKINEEIYPNFLRSDTFRKYSDNLKNNYNLKTNKALKNPYHISYTNFHPTSTQDSEYHYDPKEEAMVTTRKENKNQANLNKIKKNKLNLTELRLNRIQDFNQDQTLKVLYSTGARSHLPYKPEDDMGKVKFFFFKLRNVEKERRNIDSIENYMDQESNQSTCDQRILQVIEKFEQKADQNSSLNKIMKREGFITDSEQILIQHCSRVFHSNNVTKSLNSPKDNGLDSPKKVLKSTNYNNGRYSLNHKPITTSKLYDSYHLDSNLPTNRFNNSNQQRRLNSIIIMYQYGDGLPYSIKINSTCLTLRQFKKEIVQKKIDPNKEKYKYFFKKKDEIERMYVLEEFIDDNELLPFYDGNRIYAKIEIVSV